MDVFSVYLLCAISGIILVPFVHCQNKGFYFININMNWADARQYCRDKYIDLATVESADNLNRMGLPGGAVAWIGLFDDPASWKGFMTDDSNSWRWSATGTVSTSRYQDWATGEPNNVYGRESCVFAQGSQWRDYFCTNILNCVCYTVQSGAKEFVFVNTSKSWADSLVYCRQNYYDLAMIEDSTENQAVFNLTGTNPAWIGLHRNPWRWSDNSNSSFRNWANGEPYYLSNNDNCVALDSDHFWHDLPCANKKPFVCYKVLGNSTSEIIQFKLQSSADLTDPNIMNQILKQLEERLEEHNNGTDFQLKWSVPPTKQEKEPEKKDVCPAF